MSAALALTAREAGGARIAGEPLDRSYDKDVQFAPDEVLPDWVRGATGGVPSAVTGESQSREVSEEDVLNLGLSFSPEMWMAIKAADQAGARGDWSKAGEHVRHALEYAPKQARLHEKAALIFHLAGLWSLAEQRWSDLERLGTPRADVLANHAATRLYSGRATDALPLLERALELDSSWLPARFCLACARLAGGKEDAATDALGLLTVPETIRLAYGLSAGQGRLRKVLSEGQFAGLAEYVMSGGSRSLKPRHTSEGEGMTGVDVEGLLARLDEAHRALVLVENAMRGGDTAAAETAVARAAALGVGGPYVRFYEAFLLSVRGRVDDGKKIMGELLSRYPGHADFYYRYGTLLLEGTQFADAVEILRKGAATSPDRLDMRFALAVALAGSDQVDDAMRVLKELARKDSQSLAGWLRADFPALRKIRAHRDYATLAGIVFRLQESAAPADGKAAPAGETPE
jgi:tetratricopeptide (TPR) repeat protein